MNNLDLSLYAAHACYWAAFVIARFAARARSGKEAPATAAPETSTARNARLVVILHGLGFGLMYYAVASSVVFGSVASWFPGQRLVGAAVIAIGALLAAWSVMHFVSWRLLAELDASHQLATTGPFGLMRHPIYMSFDLLALGSAIWAPSAWSWAAVAVMAICGDIRARTEEPLLRQRFGAEYDAYCARTARFLPGLY